MTRHKWTAWPVRIGTVLAMVTAGGILLEEPAQAAVATVSYGPATTTATDSTAVKSLLLRCPGSGQPIGGSAQVNGGNGQASLVTLYPFVTGWFVGLGVAASEDPDGYAGNWSVTASIICLTSPNSLSLNTATASDNHDAAATAPCLSGSPASGSVVGTGFQATNTSSVKAAGPGGTGSRADATPSRVPGTPLPVTVTTLTLCAAVTTVVQPATSASDATDAKTVTATCPAGTHVTGDGAELGGASAAAVIDGIQVNPAGTTVTATAHEDQLGTTAPWSVTAKAICS